MAVDRSDQVLRRSITVPAAAAENMRSVLGYEMDRHTPFPADQVSFDYRIAGRSSDGQQLNVELVIAPRQVVDAPVALVSERGLALEGVDVVGSDGETFGVNLLPPAARARVVRKQLRWNLLLGAAFLILLYLVMWQSIESRERAIAKLDERVGSARVEAQQVKRLRESLSDSQAGASFLINLKKSQPVITQLLDELTRALPDDTSLQRLQINSQRIELNGEAPEPAKLIELLQAMNCIKQPAPKSAYTPNQKTGKERFVISSDIACEPRPTAVNDRPADESNDDVVEETG